jgi:hypothetical protein
MRPIDTIETDKDQLNGRIKDTGLVIKVLRINQVVFKPTNKENVMFR